MLYNSEIFFSGQKMVRKVCHIILPELCHIILVRQQWEIGEGVSKMVTKGQYKR